MIEWVSKLFDLSKLPSKIVALVLVVCSVLLFGPKALVARLQLDPIVQQYGAQIGFAWIASVAFLALNNALWMLGVARTRWRQRESKLRVQREIDSLDEAERLVLREFYLQDRDTIMLPIDEPCVAGLIRKGMLEPVGRMGYRLIAGMVFPVRMARILRKSLARANVGLPADAPSGLEMVRLLRERPAYIAEVQDEERRREGGW